jgi:hypothetical protein
MNFAAFYQRNKERVDRIRKKARKDKAEDKEAKKRMPISATPTRQPSYIQAVLESSERSFRALLEDTKESREAHERSLQAVLGDNREQRKACKEQVQGLLEDNREQREANERVVTKHIDLATTAFASVNSVTERYERLCHRLTPSEKSMSVPVTAGAAIAPVSDASTQQHLRVAPTPRQLFEHSAAVEVPVAPSTGQACEHAMIRVAPTPSTKPTPVRRTRGAASRASAQKRCVRAKPRQLFEEEANVPIWPMTGKKEKKKPCTLCPGAWERTKTFCHHHVHLPVEYER